MNSGYPHSLRLRLFSAELALVLLSCWLTRPAHAQEPGTPSPIENPKQDASTYNVSGTVVNSLTGEPVRRAAVNISGQEDGVTLTDNSGHFEFNGLRGGHVFISVMKPGFFPEQSTRSGLTTLEVAPDAPPVVLSMVPAGVILGRLTNQNERPLEGFQLRVMTRQKKGGGQMWFGSQFQARTDENGIFRMSDLPAGTYYLAVDQSQETTLSQARVPNARDQGYASVFFPGVSELSASSPLELRAGQQLEANFTIAAEPLYQVSGMAGTLGNLASPLTFTRKIGEGFDFTQTVPTRDGMFQAKLPAGSYFVTGSTANGVSLMSSGASLVIDSDSPDLHVVLVAAASIEVAVRLEGSDSASLPRFARENGIPGVYLQLVSTASDTSFGRSTKWWNPPSHEIQSVEPGTYSIEVNSGGSWWVKSIRSGGIDLLADNLTVSAGVQPPPIEITLRDDAATVIGTVTQSDSMEPVTVLLVQSGGRRSLIKVTPAIQGRFGFDGVPPGEYLLLAFDQTNQFEFEDPELLNPYLSKAAHLSLQPHGSASINLNLSPVSK